MTDLISWKLILTPSKGFNKGGELRQFDNLFDLVDDCLIDFKTEIGYPIGTQSHNHNTCLLL